MPRPPKTDRLSQLAAIAQLMGTLDRPQEREEAAGATHQEMALRMMGLMQQAQNEQAQRALQQQQITQEGNYQQGQLADTQERTRIGAQEHEDTIKNQELMRRESIARSLNLNGIDETKAWLAGKTPEEGIQGVEELRTNKKVPGMQKLIQDTIYNVPSIAHDPQKVHEALTSLGNADPDVFNKIDWNKIDYHQLAAATPSNVPPDVGSQAGAALHNLPGNVLGAAVKGATALGDEEQNFWGQLMGLGTPNNKATPPPDPRRRIPGMSPQLSPYIDFNQQ